MFTKTAKSPRLPSTTRYQFESPIGTGAMGTVYRGLDRETGRRVAIKVLKFKLSENPTLHQRLVREFKAASGLDHPNIVRALAMDNDGELSFVVYELIEGGSLADRMERTGKLSEDESLRVITQIAQALQYAHDRKVVHRDVKPDNILIAQDGTAKLTDFGLAKDYGDQDEALTRAATGLGTPNFMAPEQFADARTADARCDVYSLAGTLYTLLTGELPFDAKTTLAMLTMKEMLNLPPVRHYVPGLSERVDAAIFAALDPDPNKRPASCLEFFRHLTGRRWRKESLLVTPAPIPTPMVPGNNRRGTRRFSLKMGSCLIMDTSVHGGIEEKWPLVVRDVSTTGAGVVLARRFEIGTELTLDLSIDPDKPQLVPARVVRVQNGRAGNWVHGCSFDRPISAELLKRLVKLT